MRPIPALFACLWMTSAALASTPQLASVRPPGGPRGHEIEVTLSGARLGDALEILWYRPGIETLGIDKVDDNKVTARLRIADDCPLGIHDLRLRTATGVSELRTFVVGTLPEINEVEPNNDFQKPQLIPLNVVVNGIAEREDDDYFLIEAKKGQRITAEVEGLRLGISHFDPYVAILDTKRFELATSDDAALARVDGVVSLMAPEDGQYIIQVRESAYAGNANCLYRLHVGTFPRPRALVPAGGKLGETTEVRWIGDVAGERTTSVSLPGQLEPNFALFAQDDGGIAPHPNPFRLSPFGNVIEVEPNDDHNSATPFTPPIALNGVIDKPDDEDHFGFRATKGQVFDIGVYARRLRSPLDPVLVVSKKGGGAVASNDDAGGPDSALRFTAPDDGDYVVTVRDHLRKGGPTYFYRIELTPVEPKLAMSVPSEQAAIGIPNITLAVPKGGRQAILVNASRVDWGGDLKVSPETLPPGVTMEADVMPANQGIVPMLVSATADAPLGGLLTRIVGTPVDPNAKVASQSFAHNSVLVFGANNVDFWSRTVDRIAVAVTDESPFAIDVVEPKVPLVHGGNMGLKVVARRKEGFNAPIALSVPWVPPNVGASGGIVIPEGQNEAIIPFNAAGNAEARTWTLVINGEGAGPTGPVRVSSQLFKLTIATPYVQFAYTNAAVEQGKNAQLAVKVTKLKDFEGEAVVNLIGLPNKATAEPLKITKETTELLVPILTAPETPVGNHANLFCQVTVTEQGEPIIHSLGGAALRVDAPIPPKPNATPPPAATAEAKPAAAPAKPLSRLEQLRLEAAEKAKSGTKAEDK